jgi:hypothetical protein
MKNLEKLKQDYASAQSLKKQKELELNILNDYCWKMQMDLQKLKDDYRIYTIKSSFGEIGKVIREKDIDLTTLLDCYIPEVLFTKTWFKGTPKEYTNEYTRDCSVVAILKVEEIK